ncbi:uncharacterized protein LOC112162945 isoform X2 [Oryzias melastigma]|uniref:uncharacterized protein LOC112162945 isoform X2 n=1 Tax=Oryzias melastigma TaxID=30732 RepID=UPI00168D5CCE|nr:uncharacterized protein LOC112162945 isoform X2 [Oryzias melastigma]
MLLQLLLLLLLAEAMRNVNSGPLKGAKKVSHSKEELKKQHDPETLEEMLNEDYALVEGDILLKNSRNVVGNRWPMLSIPYDISPEIRGTTASTTTFSSKSATDVRPMWASGAGRRTCSWRPSARWGTSPTRSCTRWASSTNTPGWTARSTSPSSPKTSYPGWRTTSRRITERRSTCSTTTPPSCTTAGNSSPLTESPPSSRTKTWRTWARGPG